MGSGSAKSFGMEDAPTTLVDSIVGVTKSIDGATKEGQSGELISFDGTVNGW